MCAGAPQTFWDGFDPKAQSFRTWAPEFYDEALAAADAEIRWLTGLLPDQVGSTHESTLAWTRCKTNMIAGSARLS